MANSFEDRSSTNRCHLTKSFNESPKQLNELVFCKCFVCILLGGQEDYPIPLGTPRECHRQICGCALQIN